MPSIIEGYNYDIFISYRQKDNKYDGWVTEFVDNLKRELESAFKDEISVYFDINPHDGLLETHDVDASLEKKLNCLIFMPILSRTYCDPRAFAWDHEFKAFIEQASKDQFGLKVTLPNGNVANRVLPIRINDLDASDIKLCESIIGSVIRGIDFIYKESGVNRPLRSNEDNPHDNLNHTIYRNQINKVALAVKDIIESMKLSISQVNVEQKEILVKGNDDRKEKKTKESVGTLITILKPELTPDKIRFVERRKFLPTRNLKILIPVILSVLVIIGVITIFFIRQSKVRWAKAIALPEIEQYINDNNFSAAFNLVKKAGKYISDEAIFKELALVATAKLTVLTNPSGADVYLREYSDLEGVWKRFGTTPIDTMKVPNNTFYLVRLEKAGYENVLAVVRTGLDTLYRKLFKEATIPLNMIYVEGYMKEVAGSFLKEKNGFFMDRCEVTNEQFKEFVDGGGYRNPTYWGNEFIKDGKTLPWAEAMAIFTDKSGRPGPSTWEAGDYPDGQDKYPVSGVSWYEAAAFAVFAGKDLPTMYHWRSGAGQDIPYMTTYFSTAINSLSNFNGKSPEPTGKLPGINSYGAYDMAGNVREWCWNKTEVGRIIRGGAWDDATYLYSTISQLPAFDRSGKNGFRCVKYIDKEKIPESAFQMFEVGKGRDYYKEKAISENTFMIYKNQFQYDKTDLNTKIEAKDESSKDWIIEKITFNAAYGNERIVAYLFLPTNVVPPYQTLIFFPGASAITEKNLLAYKRNFWLFDFILKNGRAVMFPVYKGTFERNDGVTSNVPNHTHQYTEDLIKWIKDLSRSIDYLETRTDIDNSKLGFFGYSWGGRLGGIIPAVEERLKVSVLVIGGFNFRTSNWPYPEAEELNYVSRVKSPVLMLNGKFDYNFPFETTVKPFFDLLGTPEKDKLLKIYETDHYVPKSEMIKETLYWLDKYLGPVK